MKYIIIIIIIIIELLTANIVYIFRLLKSAEFMFRQLQELTGIWTFHGYDKASISK
jgi:hypothetical protein